MPLAAAQDIALQVEQMAALGESVETIAASLGLTVAELRWRYADALNRGPARRHRELIGLLFEAARAGNVRTLLLLEARTRATLAKREAERAAADDAEVSTGPKLVVVNG